MDGILNVLKPVGMTSADVVRWVLKKTKASKAGHIGTLDPGAAGVLPILLGKATRLAEYHAQAGKYYRAELTLGITTDTQDAFGQVLSQQQPNVSKKEFVQVLSRFRGAVKQTPPMFSAVRKDGKHLYEYARVGLEVSREERLITIHSIELVDWHDDIYPKVLLDIDCSKGTYIRTLCQDIGGELGCGAHMSFLLRVRAGKFSLEHSFTLEEIEDGLRSENYSFLLSPEWGLELPKINLPLVRLDAFRNGLDTDEKWFEFHSMEEKVILQVFCEDRFIGIGKWSDQKLRPIKVLY